MVNDEPVAYSIYKAKNEKKPIFNYLRSFDALTENNFDATFFDIQCYYPQIEDFKQMLDEYPDSVYILNSRKIKKQVQPMLKSGTGQSIMYNCTDKYLFKSLSSKNDYYNDTSNILYKWIYNHNSFIRNFFSNNAIYFH